MLWTVAAPLIDGTIQGPEPEDVKAGWLALGIFVALIAAVVLLAFSLVKQLRKAQAARDAGVFDDRDATRDDGGDQSPASRD